MKYLLTFFFINFCLIASVHAQKSSDLVYVDSSGRVRWNVNDNEAYFFGINYTTPFAFAYRSLKNKRIPHKEIIDLDVQQFKRLGLNAYRIHVWDREVSDIDGNLLNNEHIELLDYLIAKLIENDIYIILTPIAWWGTGWPEPDLDTPGFSTFYSKIESTTKPEVLIAHLNYLKQFVNHKNIYTGNTYKDEDFIIGYEIINEPSLPENKNEINHYVNSTVKVLRDEGITKPIFFNISQNPGEEQWEGVASSKIDGISFQWYPTGLVKYSELNGNFLPNVFSYPLPDYTSEIYNKAKIVYEFDAADIGKSYMYPPMAHSFKKAGMQWATMFAYDPTAIAKYNSEYSTHFLNLLYTPQKALGFLIASYLFKDEDLTEKVIDSTSITMGNVLVDYNSDLSLLNSAERFYYSNSNHIPPVNTEELQHIAGYGNSDLIKYDGRGAYFFDKINDGLWKLELFPDAVWVKDPFGRNGLNEPVAKLIWKSHKMKINLPELESDYQINTQTEKYQVAANFYVDIEPGVYFITNNESFSLNKNATDLINFEKIKKYGEFINDFQSAEIINLTPSSFYENEKKKIVVEIFSNEEKLDPVLYIKKPFWRNYQKFNLIKVTDFTYEIVLPQELNSTGLLNYFVNINHDQNFLTFPGKLNISPDSWDFDPDESFTLSIYPSSDRILIYMPETDKDNLIISNIWRFAEYSADYTFDDDWEQELSVNIRNIKQNLHEFALQIYVGEYLENIQEYNGSIELQIKSTSEKLDSVIVRILCDNFSGFERTVQVNTNDNNISIPLTKPEIFKFAILPRPYPTFLPYWFESIPQTNSTNHILKPESIQIALPLPEPGTELDKYGIRLKKIYFVKGDIIE